VKDNAARALPLLAILLALATVGAFLREYRAPWRRWQAHYPAVRAAQRLLPPAREEFTPGVQQIYLAAAGRTDRCTTCHLGMENPRLANAPPPYTAHPGDYLEKHPPERFGCTLCHGGDGSATAEADAHGRSRHAESPLVPRELIEANCGVCHEQRTVAGAPLLSRGRRLIDEYSCQACHDIPGFTTAKFLGPSWDEVGAKVTRSWLTRWLEDPHSYLPRPHMPRFRLRAPDRVAIVEFLLKRTGTPEAGSSAAQWAAANPEHGGVLFRESRCITCHSVNQKGGTLGPDLGQVASKVTREWLFEWIRNPHFFQPKTPMPRFGFTDSEIRDLVAYLLSEFVGEEEPAPLPAAGVEPNVLERMGRDAFHRYGCLSCHDLKGMASPGKIGPDLSRIGARRVEGLTFAAPDTVQHTLSAWLFQKVRSPAAADSTARMPEYRFADGDVAAITVALLSLRGPIAAEELRVAQAGEAGSVPQGRVGDLFHRFRCLSCHQVQGQGGTISHAPLDVEGAKARRDWIVGFLAEPYALRVQLPERMPKLKIARAEAELIADYMGLVFVNDAVPPASDFRALPGEAEAGARSFEKHGCIACHILGSSGGYVGPGLGSTGLRLNPWWVTRCLQDPKRWVPDTMHPDYGFSEEEAHALAAYLDTFRAEPR
jgi:sulfur oxidation c-type cytochrome SoxX